MELTDIENICNQISEQRLKVDQVSEVKKKEDAKLEALEICLIETLRAQNKRNYSSNVGNFSIRIDRYVKVPKEEEKRLAFFSHLEKAGLKHLMTVHHQVLNSFYKSELTKAQEDGLDEPLIPGIDPPETREILSFRRKDNALHD